MHRPRLRLRLLGTTVQPLKRVAKFICILGIRHGRVSELSLICPCSCVFHTESAGLRDCVYAKKSFMERRKTNKPDMFCYCSSESFRILLLVIQFWCIFLRLREL